MNEEIYGAFPYYRELAYYIKRLEQYDRALAYFDMAVSITPDDQRTLIGRAATRAKAVQYEGALEDLKIALKNKPDDLIALAHKALTTYLSCEFEEALIQNLRHLPKRKKPDSFAMGVMHCTEAIENCVGARAGRPLRDYFKIIRVLAWKKAKEAQNKYANKYRRKRKRSTKKDKLQKAIDRLEKKFKNPDPEACRSFPTLQYDPELEIRDSLYTHESEKNDIPPCPPYPYKPLQRRTSNIENYMAEKYLEKMYLDKLFLRNLKKCEGVKSPNNKGYQTILKKARDGYKTLYYKQELLRTRRPFYYIKYQEGIISPALKKRLEKELERTRENVRQIILNMFTTIQQGMEQFDARKVLDTAEQLKVFCDARTRNIIPQKDSYYQYLYNLVAIALLDMKRMNYSQNPWAQLKRIFQMLGFPISREPSNDSVVKQFKDQVIDYKKQVQIIMDRLERARTLEECTFCFYELSRLHLDMKQYNMARLYGRRCVSEAYRLCNYSWIVNAKMLLARCDMQQRNRIDARTGLNDVMQIARKMQNQILVDYVEKCIAIVDKIDFDEPFGYRVVAKREKEIISVIPEQKMKIEVAYLFRKMAAMPASRRMSIMPGIRFTPEPKKSKEEVSPDAQPKTGESQFLGDNAKKG